MQSLLICSLDTHSIGRLPPMLRAAGMSVTVIGRRNLSIRRSRHVARFIESWGEVDSLLEKAAECLNQEQFEYCCLADDPVVIRAAKTLPLTCRRLLLPVNPAQADLVAYKYPLLESLDRVAMALPPFRRAQTLEEALTAYAELGPDVFLKGSAIWPRRLARAQHEAEIRSNFARMASHSPVVVQKTIVSHTLATAVLFQHGRPVCWLSYEVVRPWPTPLAAATAARLVDHPDVYPMLCTLGSVTGYHGLAGVDWLRESASGRLLFLELNARPIPGTYLGKHVGVYFASALAKFVKGEPVDPCRPADTGLEDEVSMFPQSLYRWAEGRDPQVLLRTLQDAPWDDPGLMAAHLRRWGTHYLPEHWKQLRRRWSGREEHGE